MTSLTEKARHIKAHVSIIDFLNRLGFSPSGKPAKETMYLSMLRDSDSKASFAVNERLGVWYDYGMGRGGNLIDFARLYWKDLSFKEAIEKIESVCSLDLSSGEAIRSAPSRPRIRMAVKIPNYQIEGIKPLGTSAAIGTYLNSRGVFEVAAGSASEVHYFVEDEKKLRKQYFAAGWQNELGGWEVRNKYFKGCLGKKAITFFSDDPKQLVVFEGYMNYLSWRRDHPGSRASALVLNSLSLLEIGIEKAKAFPAIDVYFDRDKSGYEALSAWMKALPYSTDRSAIYQGYNDYNDKLIADLKKERKSLNANR